MNVYEKIYYTNDSAGQNGLCFCEFYCDDNVKLSDEKMKMLFRGVNSWGETTYQYNGNPADYDWYLDNFSYEELDEMVNEVNDGDEEGAFIIIAYYKYDEDGETDTEFDVDNNYYLGCEAVSVRDVLTAHGYSKE